MERTGLCVALYTIGRRFRYKSLVLSSLVRCGLKQVLLWAAGIAQPGELTFHRAHFDLI